MNTRLVAAFRGSAQCRRESGAVQWCISGLDRDNGAALQVLLTGGAEVRLPPELATAELHVSDEDSKASWELRGNGTLYPLSVRGVQVHRAAAAAFAAALPRISPPWTTRAGWWLLLNLLRLPGMAKLLQSLRARRGA